MKKTSYMMGLCVAIFLVGCTGTSGELDTSNDDGTSTSTTENEGTENEGTENEGTETTDGTSTTTIDNHNQGFNCAQCHSSGENTFASGGTVYSNATTFANGYKIRLVKSDGSLANYLEGRGTGNSHLITFSGTTFTAKVVDASGNIVNSSLTNSHDSSRLDCNRCHTEAGLNSAPGRILTTQTVVTTPAVTTPVVTTPVVTTPVVTAPLAKSFSTDVIPVLEAKCKSCHGSNGNFTVTTASATHTNLTSNSFLDTATPANSKLLQKATGNSHGGGTIITTTSAEYTTLKAWVTEGALNN